MNTITIKGKDYSAKRHGDHFVLDGANGRRLVLTRQIGDCDDGSFGYTGDLHCFARQGDRVRRIYTDLTFRQEGSDSRIVISN